MLRAMVRTMADLWHRPAGRAALFGLAAIFALGTTFYRIIEGWSWLDSLYFTVVTLTTVGYGDFAPTSGLSRAFTILLIVTGVAYIIAVLNFVVSRSLQRRNETHD